MRRRQTPGIGQATWRVNMVRCCISERGRLSGSLLICRSTTGTRSAANAHDAPARSEVHSSPQAPRINVICYRLGIRALMSSQPSGWM